MTTLSDKIKNGFKDLLEDAKEAYNTRADDKTGTYYVKGRGGYTRTHENPISGATHYSSDPNKK